MVYDRYRQQGKFLPMYVARPFKDVDSFLREITIARDNVDSLSTKLTLIDKRGNILAEYRSTDDCIRISGTRKSCYCIEYGRKWSIDPRKRLNTLMNVH